MIKDRQVSLRKMLPTVVKNEGFFALYRGFAANSIRDVPGWGLYFYFYELYKDLSKKYSDRYLGPAKRPATRETIINVNAGGLAGVMSWLLLYPFDIVKTQI